MLRALGFNGIAICLNMSIELVRYRLDVSGSGSNMIRPLSLSFMFFFLFENKAFEKY